MFDAQTLPRRRSKWPHKSILNLAPVVGRVASFSYQGMLAEIYEHLTDVREHEWRSFGARLARVLSNCWVRRGFMWTIIEV